MEVYKRCAETTVAIDETPSEKPNNRSLSATTDWSALHFYKWSLNMSFIENVVLNYRKDYSRGTTIKNQPSRLKTLITLSYSLAWRGGLDSRPTSNLLRMNSESNTISLT